ncbi:AraC family transcriptional regulator [Sinomicrobium weinanense]|uniref:Helix-turn-helix domain-containing protein n=1 Tax=Sinomicrobium weinanense TaxID=2842200 RepID=A0A926JT16_9FLAO|nr:AraC family transcriptional regulator [Sinomicrobium weinanense]MBC9796784.1 helix-turn-helix domain-containing protein [Sinomicrobium weinanense]MBU3125529.1 AraC family transcriptional regulator [Sinomicrobium weinanense]
MKEIPVRTIKEPDFSGSFAISDLGDLLAEKDMVEALHRHNFFFVLAIEKGTGTHHIDFTAYPVTDHSVFVIRPGQVHQLTIKQGSKGYLMVFDPGFYPPQKEPKNQLFKKANRKNYYKPDSGKFRRLLHILDNIFLEHSDRQTGYKEVIKSNLDIFFIELARQNQEPDSISKSNTSYAQERLQEFLELLESHICTNKQVVFYAEMLHLTPYQLNAITKNILDKTCSQLIYEHVVLEAKRNLLATSNQVNEIAYHLGYEDTSYFIRFFKKHTGFSPETFRQNFK